MLRRIAGTFASDLSALIIQDAYARVLPEHAQTAAAKMDSSQHMILPKGFVVNSEDIYKEVASYPVVPPEKIREYWGGECS